MTASSDFSRRVRAIHNELGIPPDYPESCGLPLCVEPPELVETEPDFYGRPQRLTPAAFAAWRVMRDAATADGVPLFLISAFRGLDYQAGLIRRKLDQGQSMGQILAVNAAPGYSEHHTGRAVDLGTVECDALAEEFKNTPAYQWLVEQAREYGFHLSYPPGNQFGIAFEPWHWCFQP